jgi:hypothetical protein
MQDFKGVSSITMQCLKGATKAQRDLPVNMDINSPTRSMHSLKGVSSITMSNPH